MYYIGQQTTIVSTKLLCRVDFFQGVKIIYAFKPFWTLTMKE